MKIAIALAAAVLAGAAAPAAHATTVSYAGDGALVVTAAPGETNRIGIQSDPWGEGRVVIYEGGPDVAIGAPADRCIPEMYFVRCTWSPAAGVRVDLGDGDDRGTISDELPANARFSLAGGAGDDRLQAGLDGQATTLDGGAGKDELQGGPGPDLLSGGAGDDALEGRDGADRLDGGDGNDLLSGDGNKDAAADVIDGGAGYDRIESDWSPSAYDAPLEPVTVTLAGGADDGRPGEGDDVRNVERVITHGPSRLVGTDAPEYLEAFQVDEPSVIEGGGGNDTLRANDGADRLDGGPGDDDIDAGFGDDTIVGGPGRDSIAGDRRGGDCGPLWCKLPFGNDSIDARDGERDSVTCGLGEDRVLADAVDVVAGDCETVVRDGAPAGPGGGAGAGGGGASGGAPSPAPALRVAAVATPLRRALAHGLALRVTTPGAGRLTARTAGASGAAKARRAGAVKLVLRFTSAARKRLRPARRLKLAITVRFAAASGPATQRTLRVTLRR